MDGSYCSLFETTDDDILSLDVKSTARCELPSLVDALGENGIGAEAWCEALKPFVAEKAAVTVVAAADMRQASNPSLAISGRRRTQLATEDALDMPWSYEQWPARRGR